MDKIKAEGPGVRHKTEDVGGSAQALAQAKTKAAVFRREHSKTGGGRKAEL